MKRKISRLQIHWIYFALPSTNSRRNSRSSGKASVMPMEEGTSETEVVIMAKLTMVEAINLALRQEMEKDARVVILGEDVGKNGGVFRVTQGLFDTFGERRVVDTPLSESAIVGAAIGMAVYGLKPVAEIQFEGFVYASMEQLADHAGRIRT